MLTKKQHELLVFIQSRLAESSVSPSFDEMKEALGLRSKSGIHRLVSGLEERGFIRRLPHRARALEVLKPVEPAPDARQPASEGAANNDFSPRVIKGHFGRSVQSSMSASMQTAMQDVSSSQDTGEDMHENIQLPLYGKIAAGTPIEALRDNSHTIDVPPSMLGMGDHYALEVEGDSMIDAGIHEGDTVIINRCDTAENGTIVVALVDETEVTLKRLRKRGDSVALEPANGAYKTRICGPDQVRVQGKLVGLLRRY